MNCSFPHLCSEIEAVTFFYKAPLLSQVRETTELGYSRSQMAKVVTSNLPAHFLFKNWSHALCFYDFFLHLQSFFTQDIECLFLF